jgi:four helix bundle protein
MQDAEKLLVYREARELAVRVYRLTATFPADERFGLVQQLRRAAVSVGSNIAEGCGRKGSRALLPFLYYAVGSIKEITFQLGLSEALGCCTARDSASLRGRAERTRRMLIRLAEAVRRRSESERWQSPPTPPLPTGQPR